MIKNSYDDANFNPYIVNDENHHRVNISDYVLGEEGIRKLQNNAFQRRKKLESIRKSLGISPRKSSLNQEYAQNKTKYDLFINSMISQYGYDIVKNALMKILNIIKD